MGKSNGAIWRKAGQGMRLGQEYRCIGQKGGQDKRKAFRACNAPQMPLPLWVPLQRLSGAFANFGNRGQFWPVPEIGGILTSPHADKPLISLKNFCQFASRKGAKLAILGKPKALKLQHKIFCIERNSGHGIMSMPC